MRVFIAVVLDDVLRSRVRDIQGTLRKERFDVKWVEPGNLHFTVKFIGELPEERIRTIQGPLERAAVDVEQRLVRNRGFSGRGEDQGGQGNGMAEQRDSHKAAGRCRAAEERRSCDPRVERASRECGRQEGRIG